MKAYKNRKQQFCAVLTVIPAVHTENIWSDLSRPVSILYIYAVFSLDGPNQSYCQALCRHPGWQLPHHWAETAWQFWKEVWLKLSLDDNKTNFTFIWASYICIVIPTFVSPSEFYITMVKWVTQERLSVRWVNRAQNMSILSLCDALTGDCEKVRGVLLVALSSSKIYSRHGSVMASFDLSTSETCDDIRKMA